MYKARDKSTGRLVALKKTRLEVRGLLAASGPASCARLPRLGSRSASCASVRASGAVRLTSASPTDPFQMEEEGVPSTALREVSLLQMLSESIYVVRRGLCLPLPPRLLELEPSPPGPGALEVRDAPPPTHSGC